MGRRRLYSTLGAGVEMEANVKIMMDILAYSDGRNDVLYISNKIGLSMSNVIESIEILVNKGLLSHSQ